MLLLLKRLLRLIYGCYAWSMFTLFGFMTALLLLVLPGLKLRREVARVVARVVLTCVGVRYRVSNPEHLPEEPCVIVANHSSYVDGILLKAALPARFSFVIKKEMTKVPIAGLLLRRIDSQFVNRINQHSGGLDARRLLRQATEGRSLVFFPEGTFTGRPGLAHFHLGAFLTAQRAGLQVVPIAIHGARRILRSGNPWPRPGSVELQVLPPVETSSEKRPRSSAEALRDQVRARMLFALDEPDISLETQNIDRTQEETPRKVVS
jgi:1-acyl-sn-glycerol-3-phosphate acyltransferase